MCFKRRNLLVCVVVEDSKLKIVRASNEPVLPGDEFYTPYGDFCDLECLDNGACFMVVDIDRAIIETRNQPGLCWVKIDTFDTVRA